MSSADSSDPVCRRDAPDALEQGASGGDAAALDPPRERQAIGSGGARQQIDDRALVFGEQRSAAHADVHERAPAEVVADDRRGVALAVEGHHDERPAQELAGARAEPRVRAREQRRQRRRREAARSARAALARWSGARRSSSASCPSVGALARPRPPAIPRARGVPPARVAARSSSSTARSPHATANIDAQSSGRLLVHGVRELRRRSRRAGRAGGRCAPWRPARPPGRGGGSGARGCARRG